MKRFKSIALVLMAITALVAFGSYKSGGKATLPVKAQNIETADADTVFVYPNHRPIAWACLDKNGVVVTYTNGCRPTTGPTCILGKCPPGTKAAPKSIEKVVDMKGAVLPPVTEE